MGGEILPFTGTARSKSGPSPRGWGNRRARPRHRISDRAIPTWVGKSSALRRRFGPPAGHPHVGGEIVLKTRWVAVPGGPSPRGWGNPLSVAMVDDAWTGHPHVGGEIPRRWSITPRLIGPSPRGWGNQFIASVFDVQQRAIPTWVGKSAWPYAFAGLISGHPHVGGEIAFVGLSYSFEDGPSPRGWGNLVDAEPQMKTPRAIPTWVGKSDHPYQIVALMKGHPHVGGEIAGVTVVRRVLAGPSPRGWGNRLRAGRGSVRRRAIPTWVGKSDTRPTTHSAPPGHPHVGGEIVSLKMFRFR